MGKQDDRVCPARAGSEAAGRARCKLSVHRRSATGNLSDIPYPLGQYSNYATGDERSKDVFGENYDRLAELKVKFDPDNLFKKWFPITPKA